MGWLERRRVRQQDAVLRAVRLFAWPGGTAEAVRKAAGVSAYAVDVHLTELRAQGFVTRYWTGDPFAVERGAVQLVWVAIPAEPDDAVDAD